MVNKVRLCGYLATDVIVKDYETPIAYGLLCCPDGESKLSGIPKTLMAQCVFKDKAVDIISKYSKQGSIIAVDAKMCFANRVDRDQFDKEYVPVYLGIAAFQFIGDTDEIDTHVIGNIQNFPVFTEMFYKGELYKQQKRKHEETTAQFAQVKQNVKHILETFESSAVRYDQEEEITEDTEIFEEDDDDDDTDIFEDDDDDDMPF